MNRSVVLTVVCCSTKDRRRSESNTTEEKYKDRGTKCAQDVQPDVDLNLIRNKQNTEVVLRHPPSDNKGSRPLSVGVRLSYSKRGSSGSDMSGSASPSHRKSRTVTGDLNLTERPRVRCFLCINIINKLRMLFGWVFLIKLFVFVALYIAES